MPSTGQATPNGQPPMLLEAPTLVHSDERDRKFAEAQKIREARFNDDECTRDSGFSRRQRSLDMLLNIHQERFIEANNNFRGLFDHHQESRGRSGDVRQSYFDAFLLRNQANFKQDISRILEEFASAEEALLAVYTVQKSAVPAVFVDMQEEVHHAIRSHAAFVLPQTNDLRLTSEERESSMSLIEYSGIDTWSWPLPGSVTSVSDEPESVSTLAKVVITNRQLKLPRCHQNSSSYVYVS